MKIGFNVKKIYENVMLYIENMTNSLGNTLLTVEAGEQLGDLEFEIPGNQNLTIVKGATATAEDTVNIRCKYYKYTYN